LVSGSGSGSHLAQRLRVGGDLEHGATPLKPTYTGTFLVARTSSVLPTAATFFWSTWNPIAATAPDSTSNDLDRKPQGNSGLE
jgi:hypothetical protein